MNRTSKTLNLQKCGRVKPEIDAVFGGLISDTPRKSIPKKVGSWSNNASATKSDLKKKKMGVQRKCVNFFGAPRSSSGNLLKCIEVC